MNRRFTRLSCVDFYVSRVTCLSLLFLAFARVTVADETKPTAAKVEREETWQVEFLGGQRVGYSYSLIDPVTEDGRDLVRTSNMSSLTIKRLGQRLTIKTTVTTEETPEGDMLKYSYEMANPPAAAISNSGTVEGNVLTIRQQVNGKTKESTKPWRPELKSPTFQDRVLRNSPMKPGQVKTFEAFLPDFGDVATIKLSAVDFVETELLDRKKARLLKIEMTVSLLKNLVISNFVDDKGENVKTSMNITGLEKVSYVVSKDEALKTIEGAELDLAVSTLVSVKKRIPNPHATRKIVYSITIPGQNPEAVIPSGETQSVKNTVGESARVTVTSVPIPEKETVSSDGKDFLGATQFLQADDKNVMEHARKAAGDATDHAQIARKMERYVYEKLTKKDFSTAMASAGEVARTMQGDCTEHAVLLAAMLRAKGIPSRVAVGLVYVDKLGAFGGHMWTEARLNGHWIPLDATLGLGGIGAAHLKLADSGLPDDGPNAIASFAPLMLVIGQLRIDDLSVE